MKKRKIFREEAVISMTREGSRWRESDGHLLVFSRVEAEDSSSPWRARESSVLFLVLSFSRSRAVTRTWRCFSLQPSKPSRRRERAEVSKKKKRRGASVESAQGSSVRTILKKKENPDESLCQQGDGVKKKKKKAAERERESAGGSLPSSFHCKRRSALKGPRGSRWS